jgi:hypothetical protein
MSTITAKMTLRYKGRPVLGFPLIKTFTTAGQLIQHDDDYASSGPPTQINVLLGTATYIAVCLRLFGPRGRLGIMDATAGADMPVINSGATVVVIGANSQVCTNAAYLELTETGVLHVQGMTALV